MNQLTFMYDQSPVRTVVIDNQPWLVAKDICDILEISNPTQAIARLDEDERSMFNIGRQGEVNIVNEYGMYSLILGSRKAEAKAFKRWVTHEVLPQIRKTGSYQVIATPSYMIEDPIDRATQWIEEARQKKLLEEQNAHKDQQLTLQAPKVALYDVAMCAGNDQSISKVAKSLNYGPNKLFRLLREKKVLFGNNTPYQRYIDAGYFTVRQVPITRTDSIMNVTQPLVTAKGIAWIHKLLQEVGDTA